ncbi:MAG: FAD-dependent oxidoreductase [Candidatus Aminicenantes bacterium]|nr:FAD-dependent oxidoreductase [Candidatus Aminicenantes bacterium]
MNIVIGAGISGLSVGQGLKRDFLVLEKSAAAGGLAGQYRAGGFAFDHGGHYFHFQGKAGVRRHVEQFGAFGQYRRDSKVFLLNRLIPFSLQYHLAYLPAELRRPILAEILADRGAGGRSLEEFLLARFGKRLYRLFFEPFLGKFYGRPLGGMLAGMDKGSIPVPRPEEVLAGFRDRRSFSEGYNPVFYYPDPSLQDFIDRYSRPLAGHIRFSERVIRVETRGKKVYTTGGKYRYENLISTIPLKELLGLLSPAPDFPRRQLQHISTLVVNAVLARRRRRFHWLYLPEKRFPFYRVGYYPGAGPARAYLEKTVLSAALQDGRRLMEGAAFTLRRTGMIAEKGEILFLDARIIPVSYVVFDRNWPRLVPAIHEHLCRQRIFSIGRYGSWNYSSMADDIRMALETAAHIGRA